MKSQVDKCPKKDSCMLIHTCTHAHIEIILSILPYISETGISRRLGHLSFEQEECFCAFHYRLQNTPQDIGVNTNTTFLGTKNYSTAYR